MCAGLAFEFEAQLRPDAFTKSVFELQAMINDLETAIKAETATTIGAMGFSWAVG